MKRSVLAVCFVCSIAGAVACGSGEEAVTAPSSTAAASTAASPTTTAGSNVRRNLASVAVAQDRAVVADGSYPTRFSIADPTSDGPTRLESLDAPVPLLFSSLTGVADRIIVTGATCDDGVTDDGIEQNCAPGTPVVYAFTPRTGNWTPIPVDLDGTVLIGAHAVALDDGATATVELLVRTADRTRAEAHLYTLDAATHSMEPQSLPPVVAPDFTCFGSDGSETFMAGIAGEAIEGAGRPHVWWRASATDDWSDVPLPSSGSFSWQPEDCIAGRLLLSAPVARAADGTLDRQHRAVFEPGTRTWRALPDLAYADVVDWSAQVHSPGPARRWADGRMLEFDAENGTYADTGVSVKSTGSVAWSVPWGSHRIVALVDGNGRPFDKYAKSDLSLAIVTLPG